MLRIAVRRAVLIDLPKALMQASTPAQRSTSAHRPTIASPALGKDQQHIPSDPTRDSNHARQGRMNQFADATATSKATLRGLQRLAAPIEKSAPYRKPAFTNVI
jgi:hypothetical protein